MRSRMSFSWPRNREFRQNPSCPAPMNRIAESHAGESRAEGQHYERNQHDQRGFVHGMIAVAMIAVIMPVVRARQAR